MNDGPPSSGEPKSAPRFLLLNPEDNILVCVAGSDAGTVIDIDGADHVLASRIELGHKIARWPLKAGERVLRYGVPIGSMTTATATAGHVHSHNLTSDYIPAHGRDATGGEGGD